VKEILGAGTANLDQIKRDLVCETNSKRYWQVTTTGYEFPILSQISIITRVMMRNDMGQIMGWGKGWREGWGRCPRSMRGQVSTGGEWLCINHSILCVEVK